MVRGYRSRVNVASLTRKAKQSMPSSLWSKDQKAVSAAWLKLASRDGNSSTKILSEAAKTIIRQKEKDGVFKNRSVDQGACYMSPATDPSMYSHWCSLCGDYAGTIILCAGCRMGLCCTDLDTPTGCLEWSPKIRTSEFVFYCQFCSVKDGVPMELRLLNDAKVAKQTILFRYDPPVLIISLVWPENQAQFGRFLHERLAFSYFNNPEFVYRLEHSLDSNYNGEEVEGEDVTHHKVENPTQEAVNFLMRFQTAKIVVVIDTHSVENGAFVWTRETGAGKNPCYMLEIIRDCVPPSIYRFITANNSDSSRKYKLLVVNLACGSSVTQLMSREHLLEGHCGDVFSLANSATLVADVSSVVADFVSDWVQTNTTYDVLVAKRITPTWATKHQPVLSTRYGHVLYTGHNPIEPEGKVLKCPMHCGRGFVTKSHKTGIKVTCLRCGACCRIGKNASKNPEDKLAKVGLVKVVFPREQFSVEWRVGEAPATQPLNLPSANSSTSEVASIPTPHPDDHDLPPSPPTIIEPSSSSSRSTRAALLPPPASTRSISLPVQLVSSRDEHEPDAPGPSTRGPIKRLIIPGGLHRSRSAPVVDEEPTGSSSKRAARDVTTISGSQKRKKRA